MSVSGSGTSTDPYIASTIAEFKEAVALQNGAYIQVTADLDFKGNWLYIDYNANITVFADPTGPRIKFKNIECIDCPFIRTKTSSYTDNTITFKHIDLDLLISNKLLSASETWRFGWYCRYNLWNGANSNNTSASHAYTNFVDCNIKVRIYLMYLRTGEVPYTLFNTKLIDNCNINIDQYFIFSKQTVGLFVGPSSGKISNSIIKVTYYDPNCWGHPRTFTSTVDSTSWDANASGAKYVIQTIALENVGLFTRFSGKEDLTNQKGYVALIRDSYVNNSYFVHKNLDLVKLKPLFHYLNCVSGTSSFYDKTDGQYIYGGSTSSLYGLTTEECKDQTKLQSIGFVLSTT